MMAIEAPTILANPNEINSYDMLYHLLNTRFPRWLELNLASTIIATSHVPHGVKNKYYSASFGR